MFALVTTQSVRLQVHEQEWIPGSTKSPLRYRSPMDWDPKVQRWQASNATWISDLRPWETLTSKVTASFLPAVISMKHSRDIQYYHLYQIQRCWLQGPPKYVWDFCDKVLCYTEAMTQKKHTDWWKCSLFGLHLFWVHLSRPSWHPTALLLHQSHLLWKNFLFVGDTAEMLPPSHPKDGL